MTEVRDMFPAPQATGILRLSTYRFYRVAPFSKPHYPRRFVANPPALSIAPLFNEPPQS